MPSKPPSLRKGLPRPAWSTSRRASRQERGYGRVHDLMRQRVLREEPLCRTCTEAGYVERTTVADHIIPKAEGGTDGRGNYQGLCDPCHVRKTAKESARARARAR